jgi:hypothetical protein
MIVAHLSLSLWYCVQQQDDALHIHSVRRRGGLSISQVGVSRMIWDDAIVTHIAPHTLQVGRIRNEQRVYWHVYHGTNRVTSLTKINSKPLASLEALLVSYSFCNYCWLLQSWANFFQWLRQKSRLRQSAESMWTLESVWEIKCGPDATNWLLYKNGKRDALWRWLAWSYI